MRATADADDFVAHQTSAMVLTTAAERYGDVALLSQARDSADSAVRAAGAAPADRAVVLDAVASTLYARFSLTGDLDPLDDCVRVSTEVADIEVASVTDQAGHLGNLATALHDRYLHRGAVADLERGIALHQQAVELLPDDHPDSVMHTDNLGIALRERYELTGEVGDLQAAVRAGRTAVARSALASAHQPFRLSNLGSALRLRYQRYGRLADLDEDIHLQREGVRLLAVGHLWMPALLSNLAGSLRDRHQHLGSRADLDDAVAVLDQAATAAGPAELAGVLVEHGLALHSRYLLDGSLKTSTVRCGLFADPWSCPRTPTPPCPAGWRTWCRSCRRRRPTTRPMPRRPCGPDGGRWSWCRHTTLHLPGS